MNCEAIMWRITARGFTFEEVLILAAMNVAVSKDRNPQVQTTSVAKQKGDHACN
jgi:hypothetical protein